MLLSYEKSGDFLTVKDFLQKEVTKEVIFVKYESDGSRYNIYQYPSEKVLSFVKRIALQVVFEYLKKWSTINAGENVLEILSETNPDKFLEKEALMRNSCLKYGEDLLRLHEEVHLHRLLFANLEHLPKVTQTLCFLHNAAQIINVRKTTEEFYELLQKKLKEAEFQLGYHYL